MTEEAKLNNDMQKELSKREDWGMLDCAKWVGGAAAVGMVSAFNPFAMFSELVEGVAPEPIGPTCGGDMLMMTKVDRQDSFDTTGNPKLLREAEMKHNAREAALATSGGHSMLGHGTKPKTMLGAGEVPDPKLGQAKVGSGYDECGHNDDQMNQAGALQSA